MAPPVLEILFPKLYLLLTKQDWNANTEFQMVEVFGCKKGHTNMRALRLLYCPVFEVGCAPSVVLWAVLRCIYRSGIIISALVIAFFSNWVQISVLATSVFGDTLNAGLFAD